MKTNALPRYDDSINTTGCCPKFTPDGWDGRELHFKDKWFVRATTKSENHVPLNMAEVFTRVQSRMEAADAIDLEDCIVLSRDLSDSEAEHLFSIAAPLDGEQSIQLSGDYVTKVFEGPYTEAKAWYEAMEALVRARGMDPTEIYLFYTTCPTCAKAYGRNYFVGVARV